jgi:hypothetical protein
MVRRCSDKMAKLLLTVFNAIFLVCGLALFIIGVRDFKNAKSVNEILTGLNGLNAVVIAVGVVIIVISFLGCCGALKENSCMLNTFLALLVVLLIAEITVGYLAFDNRGKIENEARKNARNSLNLTGTSDNIREAWDDIQTSMICCGSDSYEDYQDFGRQIPESCCKQKLDKGETCGPKAKGFSEKPCFPKIKQFVNDHSLLFGIAALLIGFVEVAGIIFACCLRSAVNERYETV